ncbi:unnamed protein product [Triticum turgidum subsp. durum]|uniref:DUF676 domain-containing protein n=1 Tax=Triticum turgidum subsp. durum TaxID=4567 RepID=A0A9R1B161_TRITD|nr:unnamed protein product [Triticum turgidum subsp. durum]
MGDLAGRDCREEAAAPAPAPAVGGADHLVIMVHGIVGSTADWKYGAEQFHKLLEDRVIVHCSNSNMHKLTLDGIDVMGERLAQEVPFLFGVTAIEKFACCIIHFIFRRTGKHLFLTDNDDGKPPLLQLMVDDCEDLRFMTSSIRGASELPKVPFMNFYVYILILWVDSTSKIYPHIVYEELSKAETLDQCADVADMDKDNCTLEERLLRGLKRVSWEKVDVSFHNSKARSAAHSVIQTIVNNHVVVHGDGGSMIAWTWEFHYQAQASIAKANILDNAYSSSFNKIYRLTSVPGSTFSEYDTAVTARTGKQQVTRPIFWT